MWSYISQDLHLSDVGMRHPAGCFVVEEAFKQEFLREKMGGRGI